MKKVLILVIAGILFNSCGKWSDNIHLSVKNVTFGAEADSIIITTKGTSWWIDNISINDTTYTYYNDDSINLLGDSYMLKNDCFIVEKRDRTAIFVKLDANTTGNERYMTITFEAGDYFDYVHIKQLAE